MSDNTKYITDYSWRTIVSMVIFLPTANTYRVSVSPVDVGEPGALLPIEEGFLLVDNAGHIFPVISVGTGTIDVEDRLLCGEYPVTGMVGIVCKTAYKGNSIYIPQGQLNYLDRTAQQYIDSVVWSVLWGNDPNPKRVLFTSTDTPELRPYNTNYTDIDGVVFNPFEDYGNKPKACLLQPDNDGNILERTEKPYFEITDGNIVAIQFGQLDTVTDWIIEIRN